VQIAYLGNASVAGYVKLHRHTICL